MQPSNYYNEEDPQGNDDYIRAGIQVSSSADVDSGAHSATRSASQGEAAAILAQETQLLVHTGGVHLQQAQCG